jgi:Tol biopolymer transport system component
MRSRNPLLLAALVVAAALPSSALAADGTIAFHQKTFDDSSSDLWLAAADGSTGGVRLTGPQSPPDPSACFEACGAEAPDWLPDGSRLYFDSSWTPFVHIWSMRPDGTDARQETFSAGFDGFQSVSADGSMIAYEYSDVDDPSLNGIYLAPSTGGGEPVQLTHVPKRGFDANPDFSPDGTKVVFQRLEFNVCDPRPCGGRGDTGYTSSIWVVGTDGSGLHRIVSGGRLWSDSHYSPDGSRILIQAYDEGRGRSRGTKSNEYTVRPDGSGMRQLTVGKSEVSFSGDWSPDGSKIAFVHYQFGDDHLQIRTMDADGKNPETVAECDPELFCDFPSWGAYDGPLPAATAARARTSVSASAAGRRANRARRLRRAIRRELGGRSRGASSTAPRTGL